MVQRRHKIIIYIFFVLFFFASVPGKEALAVSTSPQWHGSFRSLNSYGEEAPANTFPEYYLSSSHLRLAMEWQPLTNWQLETALDYQSLWNDPAEAFSLPTHADNRIIDLDKVWQHGGHGTSRLQLDRLNLRWRTGAVDISIGRQAIGFGRILISSPLDIITPFAADAIDTEVRSGIDALQSTYNYGLDGQLGVTAVVTDKTDHNTCLATWTDNMTGIDLLLITGRLRGHNVLGAGLAGNLGTLGLKGEFAIHQGQNRNRIGGDLYDRYTIAAIESWYRFDNGLSLITQYLYNGPGVNAPADYARVVTSAPVREGLTTLLGKQYLIIAPSYELHPLITAQGLVIYNLKDESALIRPMLDINMADNLSLQIFWTQAVGSKPLQGSSLLPAVPRSEFGMRGESGGVFVKWFF